MIEMANYFIIPEETEDLIEWFDSLGVTFFQSIGVKKGLHILDFGCGVGTFTIPAAKVVGKTGRVYGIDSEQACIDELKSRIQKENLSSIVFPIKTDGTFKFPLEDESIDLTLLYDMIGVIIHHTNSLSSIADLMREIYRITKPDGKVSIIFKHVKNWRLPKKHVDPIITKLFSLEDIFEIPHVHWNIKEVDPVYSLVKRR